jgi:hypothetical protein
MIFSLNKRAFRVIPGRRKLDGNDSLMKSICIVWGSLEQLHRFGSKNECEPQSADSANSSIKSSQGENLDDAALF